MAMAKIQINIMETPFIGCMASTRNAIEYKLTSVWREALHCYTGSSGNIIMNNIILFLWQHRSFEVCPTVILPQNAFWL
jgi:hypothetical protein